MSEEPKKFCVSKEEWQVRVDLAACYNIVSHYGWDDPILTHISARVPGPEHHFLLNPYGMMFDEITASSLVKVDLDGKIVMDSPYGVNAAGFTIHSAVHIARHADQCAFHVHHCDAIAVASTQQGLQPYSQYAAFALASMAYHDYEGLAVNDEEIARLQSDLGTANFMLLRNHGALTMGLTIGDAFMHMYDLTRACQVQLDIKASGMKPIFAPQSIIDGIKAQANIVHTGKTGGETAWPAMIRRVYRAYPDFAS